MMGGVMSQGSNIPVRSVPVCGQIALKMCTANKGTE